MTHNCIHNSQLAKQYPRGERFLKKAFAQFAVMDTIKWFESRGVRLKTEADNRMFPVTDDSGTIIECLIKEARNLGINIVLKAPIMAIQLAQLGLVLKLDGITEKTFDKVIVCTGGSPKLSGFDWLSRLGHAIHAPVPSLFP